MRINNLSIKLLIIQMEDDFMLKIVLNKDDVHILNATNITYATTYQVGNYSTHNDTFTGYFSGNCISNLLEFEGVPITTVDIYNEDDELMTSLTFTTGFYVLNSNISVHDEAVDCYVNFGTVNQGV